MGSSISVSTLSNQQICNSGLQNAEDVLYKAIGLTEIDQSSASVTPTGLKTARSILGRTVYASGKCSL